MCRPNMDFAGQRYNYHIRILKMAPTSFPLEISEADKVSAWSSKPKLSAIEFFFFTIICRINLK